MAITKTNFINYSRCPRYVGLSEIKKDRLDADISYEQYKEEEKEERLRELLSQMYSQNEEGEEEDLIDTFDPQLDVMMPYYKRIEELAGLKVEHLFKGTSIYSESTLKQKSFEFNSDLFKYICYVDIYNENDSINIIEVKATTSNKFIEGLKAGNPKEDKYSIFIEDKDGIMHLKDEIDNYNITNEMPIYKYNSRKNKLFDRFDVGKYVYDLAVQRMIIERDPGYRNKKINYYLAVLNHEYVFDGKYENNIAVYDDSIIRLFDMTIVTEQMQEMVLRDKDKVEKYLSEMSIDEYPLGDYCEHKKPSECKFSCVCFSKIPKTNSTLSYIGSKSFKDEDGVTHKGLELINEGYLNMLDIPDSWIKNQNHHIQRNCLITNKAYINKEKINIAINNLTYPIYHLDFETFPCPLPRFKGEKCYAQSPFQFSLHIEKEPGICDKEKDHYGFLSETFNNDCREDLIKSLCELIDTSKGTVFAQNCSFEKGVLSKLAEVYPQYKDKLTKMVDMASDLIYIVKNNSKFYEELGFEKEDASKVNYYHKDLSGSYSIKKTLKVFSDLSYDNMEIGNGTSALTAYANYNNYTKEQYNEVYNNLIEYCKQDTYAMYVILNKLRDLIK